MQIKQIATDRIDPAPYNPRKDLKPGDADYEKLKQSLDAFGCVEPLVWNQQTGHLVGGHQRLKLLRARGDTEVTVSVVDLTLEREKALNIALNKITGDWDQRLLADLLDEIIRDPEMDLGLTGFDLPEATGLIEDLLAGVQAGDSDADASGEEGVDDTPVIQPGELIVLGTDPDRQHRLLCGDATDPDAVTQLMDGQKARLFMTDPPYLVDYTGSKRPFSKSKKTDANWDDPKAHHDLYRRFCRAAMDVAVAENTAWYVWHASIHQPMVHAAWEAVGIQVHQQLVWVKGRAVPGRSWYRWAHEPCLMGWQKGQRPQRVGQRKQVSVWEADSPAGAERPDHPTPKPPELFERAMRQHTVPASPGVRGDICYEPFAGSGSQIMAAQRLGRRCFALEIDPLYCDLIVRRYIAHSGVGAVTTDLAERFGCRKGVAK